MKLTIELLPDSPTDGRAAQILEAIENSFPDKVQFIGRLKPDATFAFACTYDDFYRIRWWMKDLDWLDTDPLCPLITGDEFRMFSGLTEWSGLDCWFYRVGNRKEVKFFKEEIERVIEENPFRTICPAPVGFVHRFDTGSDSCFALGDYVPTHGIKERTYYNLFIYQFKEGGNAAISEAIKMLKLAIQREEELCKLLPEAVWMVVPASERGRNHRRYAGFCRFMSRKLGVQDGFDGIEITKARKSMGGLRKKDTTTNLRFLPEYFKGKDVLLFDDILTTGFGFHQVAERLKAYGARSVTGIFLGRTVREPDAPEE